MPLPNELAKRDHGVHADFQQWLDQLTDTVNNRLGYSGTVEFADHVDMRGKNIKNVGEPVSPNDVISSAIAARRYSPEAIAPELETGKKNSLKGYRQLNSKSQRESQSSWLTDLMSTPPSANNIFPTVSNVTGGVQVSIPASIFQFADGSVVNLPGRIDLLSLPAQYAITSLAVAAGVVTCNCAASGLVAGEVATIVPGTNASYAGTFQLTSSTGGGSVLEWQDAAATGTDASGFVQVNGVWYYGIKKRQAYINLLGPFSADTAQNRLQVCFDGFTIVAVVVVTADGGQVSLCGGGGSPIVGSPTAGSFF